MDFLINSCSKSGDCKTVKSITCEGRLTNYGTKAGYMTKVTRNMCMYKDCVPDKVDIPDVKDIKKFDPSTVPNTCLMPYQPVDLVIDDDTDVIELVTVTDHCKSIILESSNSTDGKNYTEVLVGCDGKDHAAWGAPVLTNAVREGEESLFLYTHRTFLGMEASIFEPSWGIFMAMDFAIMVVDMVCFVLIFWGLWYWAAYKVSFVGPRIDFNFICWVGIYFFHVRKRINMQDLVAGRWNDTLTRAAAA